MGRISEMFVSGVDKSIFGVILPNTHFMLLLLRRAEVNNGTPKGVNVYLCPDQSDARKRSGFLPSNSLPEETVPYIPSEIVAVRVPLPLGIMKELFSWSVK